MSEEIKTLLGVGILNWNRLERVTDRYGAIHLEDPSSGAAVEFEQKATGKKGKLIAIVVKTRKSDHVGDLFRGIFPSTPEVGDRIQLGEGELFTEGVDIGLKPEPMRENDWLDPHALYRCHSQTVELYFIEPNRKDFT